MRKQIISLTEAVSFHPDVETTEDAVKKIENGEIQVTLFDPEYIDPEEELEYQGMTAITVITRKYPKESIGDTLQLFKDGAVFTTIKDPLYKITKDKQVLIDTWDHDGTMVYIAYDPTDGDNGWGVMFKIYTSINDFF